MQIKEIRAKNILTRSRIPETDYCINPYLGCLHACVYCYASFMRRFTGHQEDWGKFLDVKINAAEVLKNDLVKHVPKGAVLLGSVTDAYQGAERKYKVTRSILEVLLEHHVPISILTKSDSVQRDIDLLKQFHTCSVGLSIAILDEEAHTRFEPGTVFVERKVKCLRFLHNEGIKTYTFIGPILPLFTNLDEIYEAVNSSSDVIWAESLNTKCGNRNNIMEVLTRYYPKLAQEFNSKAHSRQYWEGKGQELDRLTEKFKVPLVGYYRH